MSNATLGLYEELTSKMDRFFATASIEEIKKSFEGIDVGALLCTSSESTELWTMLLQEASGPVKTGLYCLSEEMIQTYKFGDYNSATNNTLALAA